MDCNDFELLEPLYLTRELAEPEKQQLEMHLRECALCSRSYEKTVELDALLRDTVNQRRVQSETITTHVRLEIASQRPAKASNKIWIWALTPVTALLLLIGGLHWLNLPAPVDLFTDAADDHLQEVTLHSPIEWTSDPAAMRKLLKDWVPDPAVAEALTPPGFRLSRIRICELMNRNYLHLVYANGEREFSVFLRRRDGEVLPGNGARLSNNRYLHTAHQQKLEIAGFQTDALSVLVVGDLPKAELDGIATNAANSL